MDIDFAILGFLSWKAFSGYDLKKIISDSDVFYWSGNNNQIYKSLVELLRKGLVTQRIEYQENLPARKIYTLTGQGQAALREAALQNPELPELRHAFLIQLAWAHTLSEDELDSLLTKYADEIDLQLRMRRRPVGAQENLPKRDAREQLLWRVIEDHMLDFYRQELAWVNGLRELLSQEGNE